MTVTPERLAAYADGELDAETARTVEAEIAQSPALQAQLALHRQLRDRLAARFAPIAEEPVPEHLRQAVLAEPESEVIDFTAAARKRRAPVLPARWGRIAGPALAASLVLALLGVNLWPSGDYARGNLADALDGQLVTTQAADAPVRVLISFRDNPAIIAAASPASPPRASPAATIAAGACRNCWAARTRDRPSTGRREARRPR